MLEGMVGSTVVSVKTVQALAGKLSHLSGLILQLRPFIAPLWAIGAKRGLETGGTLPTHLVHTRRMISSLRWLMAFFAHEEDMIQRRFLVAESGLDLVIATDASTYGIGGVSFDAGTLEPKQYFTDAVNECDEKVLGIKRGSSAGMP
eukprot:1232043-Amphidinium_carterae.1